MRTASGPDVSEPQFRLHPLEADKQSRQGPLHCRPATAHVVASYGTTALFSCFNTTDVLSSQAQYVCLNFITTF